MDDIHLREKALHITTCLRVANFLAYNGWIARFKRRHNIVYRTLSGESRSVDPETAEDWKHCKKLKVMYDFPDIYSADETGLFSIYNLTKLSFLRRFFLWWYKI
jgi:hypothetical protein